MLKSQPAVYYISLQYKGCSKGLRESEGRTVKVQLSYKVPAHTLRNVFDRKPDILLPLTHFLRNANEQMRHLQDNGIHLTSTTRELHLAKYA